MSRTISIETTEGILDCRLQILDLKKIINLKSEIVNFKSYDKDSFNPNNSKSGTNH